ncbi:ABC transporter substrate-binding protein [Deltaproteobacteria bacterium OttesenSCG-928-M10]|nr:ABC transporter substrate-binding protein [Deltaproteobacteria bacterium OttesenSCG-928-M10]
MLKKLGWTIIFGLGLVLAVKAHRTLAELTRPAAPPTNPERIVSLAPSVTETLYAIGMGDQVVGVTEYCKYPPEVQSKPKVAGFSDINLEAVLRQKPDLVALPVDKIRNQTSLERLGLTVMPLNTRSLSGLMEAIEQLGQATGHQAESKVIVRRIQDGIAQAEARAEGREKPRVLFSVMHSYQGLGYITEINAVGRDGFFSQLIEIAGGVNVYQGSLAFPRLSREAVIFLNPEVIIDIIPDSEDLEAVRRDWMSLSSVTAIKNGRIIFLTDNSDTVPGPRTYQTLAKLSEAFHPLEIVRKETADAED